MKFEINNIFMSNIVLRHRRHYQKLYQREQQQIKWLKNKLNNMAYLVIESVDIL